LVSWTICLHSSLFFIFPGFRSIHPSEADCLVSKQFSLYGVMLLASRPTPTWRTRVSLFTWLLFLDLSGMDDPTSSCYRWHSSQGLRSTQAPPPQ
jgi:hypothetical protein